MAQYTFELRRLENEEEEEEAKAGNVKQLASGIGSRQNSAGAGAAGGRAAQALVLGRCRTPEGASVLRRDFVRKGSHAKKARGNSVR